MPTYDEAYYANYDGVSYADSVELHALFHHFADRVVSVLHPSKTLDAGCAIGRFVETLRSRGVEAYGFDISEYAISKADPSIKDYVKVATLTDPIEGTYDLVTCIEVIEHLPADEAPEAIANLCSVTDRVLLSSTPYEHEEPTHLNVQPPEYWSEMFAREGFFRNTEFDATFISPWAVLYERRRADLAERVRDYDRSFWRVRDENIKLRNALLAATSGGDDSESSNGSEANRLNAELAAAHARIEALEAEVIEQRHERLRIVDEAVGANRRAGQALGRVRELEGEVARLHSLRTRYEEVINSTTWQLSWKALAPYRALRERGGR